MLAQALKGRAALRPEMVLMYPQPTIVNKLVLVAMTERGPSWPSWPRARSCRPSRWSRASAGDPAAFADTAKRAGLAVDTTQLTQVVDPPALT